MSDGKRYVLDANVFIEASRKYYAFDLCKGFWRALIRQHESKRVFSIDRVKAELTAGGDELSEWAKEKAPDTFFKRTLDMAVRDSFAAVMKWVHAERQFEPDAKAQFASAADGWVIAYAHVNGLAVVTHEEYAPEAKRKVPMPNLCIEFDVEYCNTFAMLRELSAQFVLKSGNIRHSKFGDMIVRPGQYVAPERIEHDLSPLQRQVLQMLAKDGSCSLAEIMVKLPRRTPKRTVQDSVGDCFLPWPFLLTDSATMKDKGASPMTIHAIYENGVFRPMEKVALPDRCEVEVEIRQVDV